MKTLAEIKQAASNGENVAADLLQKACSWPVPNPCEDPLTPKTIESIKKQLKKNSGWYVPIGIACDNCKFELVADPSFMLTAARRWVYCIACGFQDTQSERDQ